MKRLISMLLVVVTILAAFPAVAFADEIAAEPEEVCVEATDASQKPFAAKYGTVCLVKGKTIKFPHQSGFKYSSSNKKVFTVSKTGVITGINYGKATLKVRYPDGTCDTWTIKVTKRTSVGVTVYGKQEVEIRVLNNYMNKGIRKVKVLIQLYNKKNQQIYKKYHTLTVPSSADPIWYGNKGIWTVPFTKAIISKAKVTISRVYYEDGTSAPN